MLCSARDSHLLSTGQGTRQTLCSLVSTVLLRNSNGAGHSPSKLALQSSGLAWASMEF